MYDEMSSSDAYHENVSGPDIRAMQRQKFHESEANKLHPEGCRCPDRSGSCEWCRVYYNGAEVA